MNANDRALVKLGRALRELGYEFVTVTPETHRRVLERDDRRARSLRDVFGWNRPFEPGALPEQVLSLARDAGVLAEHGSALRARVRFSTLEGHLFVHSGFPTREADAVFFGPDTVRFAAFVRRWLRRTSRLVDVGCGSGAGGIVVAASAERMVLADVNPAALRLARVNAALAGVTAEVVESDVLGGVDGPIDAVIANPPYLVDAEHRLYRDGGGSLGEGLSVRIARESLARLSVGGTLLLYTGAPIVEGVDRFRRAVEPLCRAAGASFHYEELDPDVFGEELARPSYAEVDRIAAVGLVAVRVMLSAR
jgi:release factor glutamine methyltransferase